MSTFPTLFRVPRSLLVSHKAPAFLGSSFNAWVKVEVKVGKITASSSRTSSGLPLLAHCLQAFKWEAQQPRSPGDILIFLSRYQWNIWAKRAVLQVFTTSLQGTCVTLPSTAAKRCNFSQGAFLARLRCRASKRSGLFSRFITTARSLRRLEDTLETFTVFATVFLAALPFIMVDKDFCFITFFTFATMVDSYPTVQQLPKQQLCQLRSYSHWSC